MRCLLCFFLQNGCSGRGCLNNICIASYGVGAKFFTTNLMSVDIPQMARRRHGSRLLREPSTNGTDGHRCRRVWHPCHTHAANPGVQQSLLHQTTATPPTDFSLGGYGILPYPRHLLWDIIPQNTPNSQNLLQRRASHGFHRFTQILRVRCSPTEFTEYTELGSVGMQQGCHTLLICEHPCSSVGGSSLPEGSVRSVRSVGEHRSLVGGVSKLPYSKKITKP